MIQHLGDLDADWELTLVEATVTLVMLDQRLSVTLTDDDLDVLDVILAAAFIARTAPDEPAFTLEPNTADPRLGLFAVALKPQRLHECRCTLDGTLLLGFDGGTSVELPPSESYEAWEVSYRPRAEHRAGFKVVCLPGGERAVWEHGAGAG